MVLRLNKAFTLLEVLITVTILATVMLFIFRSFATSLYATRLAGDISLACYLAADKLDEIERTKMSIQDLPKSGAQEIQNKTFKLNYAVSDTDNPALKELKLAVSWKQNLRSKDYTMEFLTYFEPEK